MKAVPADARGGATIAAKTDEPTPDIDSIASTAELKVPKLVISQVIGQERAVAVVKKAAAQKRNVLLVGSPGTGKSLLAQSLAELMPASELEDILVYANPADENTPRIRTVKAGEGRKILEGERVKIALPGSNSNLLLIGFLFLSTFFLLYFGRKQFGDVITAALLIGLFIVSALVMFASQVGRRGLFAGVHDPVKLLIDNADHKIPPFVDATGSRAGSLLGDVRHDPLQCHFPVVTIYKREGDTTTPLLVSDVVDSLLAKYPDQVDRSKLGWEGLTIPPEEEIFVLGAVDGKAAPVRLLAVNRHAYEGELRAVNFRGLRTVLTPEHKVFDGGQYVAARNLEANPAMVEHRENVLSQQELWAGFSEAEVHSTKNYFRYLNLRDEHPEYGFKKAAKILGLKEGQVRWWHHKGSEPSGFKTTDFLNAQDLLPLSAFDERLPLIARILGALFGDGGIAGNLNNIFLSSSEESSRTAFKEDLVGIFGKEIDDNFSVISSGVNGTGRCIRNSNRAVVRFFAALGAPVGRKNQPLAIPRWIFLREDTQKEFFGAFFGSELCSPTFREKHHSLNALEIPACGPANLRESRLAFLKEIELFLNSYGIRCGAVGEREFRPGRILWRLSVSKDFENFSRFVSLIPIRYSQAKEKRLHLALEQMTAQKTAKLAEMSAGAVVSQHSQRYLSIALKAPWTVLEMLRRKEQMEHSDSRFDYAGTVYNVTTESGNLFANGILVKNSGGLGTPSHLRVEPGAIHRANKGVLFIDEIATLHPRSQQELLTAMQEKKYAISGQSEMSSGALVHTESVPCDFVLVASGNYNDIQRMHPALRSRIRGYGYEVFMEESIADSRENRAKMAQFVAQEVTKDGKIPHFGKEALQEILHEARKRAGRKNRLTLKLRELGGLVRAAGDVAREKGHALTTKEDVWEAKKIAVTVEQQAARQIIEMRRDYKVFLNSGFEIGKVNGLAVMGDSGVILPLVSEVAPAASKQEGKIIATGKLGSIAKEAVENVSAIIKKHTGKDTSTFDIHVQFLQTYEGVEGDSASISVATAVISALEEVAIDQSIGLTGSLSVRGQVLPVGGVSQKIEAAVEAGLKTVLVPKANYEDLALDDGIRRNIKVIPVSNISEVLSLSLKKGPAATRLLSKIKAEFTD